MAARDHLRLDHDGLGEDVEALKRVADAGSTRLPDRIDFRADAGPDFARDLDALHEALERIERHVREKIDNIAKDLNHRLVSVAAATALDEHVAARRRDVDPARPGDERKFQTMPFEPGEDPAVRTLPFGASGAPPATVPFGAPVEAPFPMLAELGDLAGVGQRRRQALGWQ